MVCCPVCGKKFESADQYAQHVSHRHPNVKTVCTSCGTCFPPVSEPEEEVDTSKYDWAMSVLAQRMKDVQLTMNLEPGEVPALRTEDMTKEELEALAYLERIGQPPPLAAIKQLSQRHAATWSQGYEEVPSGAVAAAQGLLTTQPVSPTVSRENTSGASLEVIPETPPDLVSVSSGDEEVGEVAISSTDEEDLVVDGRRVKFEDQQHQ